MRVERSVFKYIEYELYCYQQTKKEIEIFKEYIINSSPIPSEIKDKGHISDTTANKANKIVTSAFLNKAERTINAIDKSLSLLSKKHNNLFKLKYLEGLTFKEIYLELNISDRTFYRLRRELVVTVGLQLGLLRE